MRLDKFICKSTDLTRDQAIAEIGSAQVTVNGVVVLDPATQVHEDNSILLAGSPLSLRPSRYIMLHKPLHTLSSNVDGDYPSVMNILIQAGFDKVCDLHITGRLDADTTGLMLITDDGRWSFNIINPKYLCSKRYRVTLRDAIAPSQFEQLVERFAKGIALPGEAKLTLPAKLEAVSCGAGGINEVHLTIQEGRYHQVKRMFAAIGNRVNGLHRESIGAVTLDIPVGEWRYLSADEVNSFTVEQLTID